jgi:hypothetical protein
VVLRTFEQRLEKMVEGAFSRAFKSGLRPVEIGRKLAREMDLNRSVGVNGRPTVPNRFIVYLSESDHEGFASMETALTRELTDAVREHARDEGYAFVGPVRVELAVDERMRTGAFQIESEMSEGAGGAGAGSLILPGGQRIGLTERVLTIGRLPESHVTLQDTNASRHHAEIRPSGDGFVVVDLNSTNGTSVNGVRMSQQLLRDGDIIQIGNTKLLFEDA